MHAVREAALDAGRRSNLEALRTGLKEAAGHMAEKVAEKVAFAAGFLCSASEVTAENIWAARVSLARAVVGQGATVNAVVSLS
jgi:hypothetical protein